MPAVYETTIAELRQTLGPSYMITSDVSPRSEPRSARDYAFGGVLRFYKEETDVCQRAYWRCLGSCSDFASLPEDFKGILQLLLCDRLEAPGGVEGMARETGMGTGKIRI